MKKVIIFGNGLGMALNDNDFSLKVAIKGIWESEGLTTDEKKLINDCLPDGSAFDFPEGEEDMDHLYVAEICCRMLSKLNSPDYWLQPKAADFPKTISKFIHNVAAYFHKIDTTLPESFMTPLITFIKKTNSHIATLNYDSLLYSPLCTKKICYGYDGCLVDGIWESTGFDPNNLRRLPGKEFGYYLHLHGSPLFQDINGTVKKMKRSDLFDYNHDGTVGNHLVLTHVKHKPLVISSSLLLSTYWYVLAKAISESEEIMLFGYSGLDPHLNELLSGYPDRPFQVVEYTNGKNQNDREHFWKKKLHVKNIKVILCQSVLKFKNWDK